MMENVIGQLFTLPNLILCLMIWVLVWVQRRVVEEAWKGAKTNKWWNDLALPLAPLMNGAAIGAAIPQYPYPDEFKTFWARIFFAIVCGLISAHAYKIVKKVIQKESGDGSGPDDPADILDDK
jgi:membrane protein required for beta-lactamase induction